MFNLDGENQTNVRLRSKRGIESMQKIGCYTKMNNEEKIRYEKKLKIYYHGNFHYSPTNQEKNQRVVPIYSNPYF